MTREGMRTGADFEQRDAAVHVRLDSMDVTPPSLLGSQSVSLVKRSTRPRYVSRENCALLLKELDETVASIGVLYKTRTYLNHDNSIDSGMRKTISQQDGRICNAAQHEDEASRTGGCHASCTFPWTEADVTGRLTPLNRGWLPSRKRKRRGYLERVVASTILSGYTESVPDDFQFSETSGSQGASSDSGADYILQDLLQACAILECELEARDRAPPEPYESRGQSMDKHLHITNPSSTSRKLENVVSTPDIFDEGPGQSNDSSMSCYEVDDAEDISCKVQGAEYIAMPFAEPEIVGAVGSDDVCHVAEEDMPDCVPIASTGSLPTAESFLDRNDWTEFADNPFDAASDGKFHLTEVAKSHFTVVRPWKTSELGWKHAPRGT